jgi:3-oxoacyl-[acyl-carrier protein] reductase
MTDILNLKGRVALVTGAGQGVGRQVALQLAQAGAGGVIVNDYHLERAEAVADEIRALGGKALPYQADISDYDAVRGMADAGVAAFGQVDILVNNAGNAGPVHDVTQMKPFWDTEPSEWDRFLATNFYGVLNCSKAVLPGMMERRYGRITTVISDAGRVGEASLAVYSGAKAGAAGFMRALAKGAGRANITCNCVALSGIRTPGLASALTDETVAKALKFYVIRRMGEPEDAANMILFLSSDAASWITVQTFPVNGGYAFSA